MGKVEELFAEANILRGRVAFSEGQMQSASDQITEAQSKLEAVAKERQDFWDGKELAVAAVQEGYENIIKREQDVATAQANLEKAMEYVATREDEEKLFTVEAKKEHDAICVRSEEALEKAISSRDALAEKIEATKQDLAGKLAALKKNGVELNFEPPRAPQKSYF